MTDNDLYDLYGIWQRVESRKCANGFPLVGVWHEMAMNWYFNELEKHLLPFKGGEKWDSRTTSR